MTGRDTPLRRWFLQHPASVDESYGEHLSAASRFGGRMVAGGIACMIHGLVPALFTRTGSNTVKALYTELRNRQPAFAPQRPAYDEPQWQLEYEI